jgi:hypothetical protein
MTHWTVKLEEDLETGDLILPFPLDLLEQAGWKEGDTIIWKMQENGSCILEKKSV